MQMNLRAGLALAAILGLLLAPTAHATEDRPDDGPGLFTPLDRLFEWIFAELQSLEALGGTPPPSGETTTQDPPPPDEDPPDDPDDEKGPVTDPGGSPGGGGG